MDKISGIRDSGLEDVVVGLLAKLTGHGGKGMSGTSELTFLSGLPKMGENSSALPNKAARQNQPEAVLLLLAHGVDPHISFQLDSIAIKVGPGHALDLLHLPMQFQRSLMDDIAWEARLIGFKGARGAGNTTLMLN
jgi:hypothetical protein